jgi:hypothetical protein
MQFGEGAVFQHSSTPDSALSYSRRKDDDEGSDSTELAEVLPAIAPPPRVRGVTILA